MVNKKKETKSEVEGVITAFVLVALIVVGLFWVSGFSFLTPKFEAKDIMTCNVGESYRIDSDRYKSVEVTSNNDYYCSLEAELDRPIEIFNQRIYDVEMQCGKQCYNTWAHKYAASDAEVISTCCHVR